jgi:hypothetical protein
MLHGITSNNTFYILEKFYWGPWGYNTNGVVGAYVTAGARLHMYSYLDKLQQYSYLDKLQHRAIYCDTDSVFVQPSDEAALVEPGTTWAP